MADDPRGARATEEWGYIAGKSWGTPDADNSSAVWYE